MASMDEERTTITVDLVELRKAVRENPAMLSGVFEFIASGLAPSEDSGCPPEQRKGPYPGGHARPEYVQTFTRPDEPIPEDIRRELEALKVQVRTPPPPYGTGADNKHARPAGFLHHPVSPPRDEDPDPSRPS
jgi:hypothetical protein